jgi:hypothetical protein
VRFRMRGGHHSGPCCQGGESDSEFVLAQLAVNRRVQQNTSVLEASAPSGEFVDEDILRALGEVPVEFRKIALLPPP